jgi:hypothetical protein
VAITRETLRLQQQLRDEVNTITDQQVRDLVGAWADAWDEVSLDLEAALRDLTTAAEGRRITRALVMRTERLTRSLLVINNRLTTLAKDAGVRITGDLETVVRLADDFQHDIVASQLPPGERELVDAWSKVDGRALRAIVRRSTQQITSRTRPLSREAMTAVRRELVRGVAAGSNPNDVAAKMLQRVEGRFLGGAARATAIARTEMLDAHRQASRESRIANSDVLAGWVWHSELSVRTCASCWAQDGSLHPADDPGPMDHVNGRCTALPQTKSWADLGFAGMDEPRSIKPDARTTFIALDERQQKAILGPARHEAWKAGDYPMSDWSARRTADGWRDSYGVSRLPQSGGRRGSSTALAS